VARLPPLFLLCVHPGCVVVGASGRTLNHWCLPLRKGMRRPKEAERAGEEERRRVPHGAARIAGFLLVGIACNFEYRCLTRWRTRLREREGKEKKNERGKCPGIGRRVMAWHWWLGFG
jgi:hypothetical protein